MKLWIPLNQVTLIRTNNHLRRFRYRQERRATVICPVAVGPMAAGGGAVTVKGVTSGAHIYCSFGQFEITTFVYLAAP